MGDRFFACKVQKVFENCKNSRVFDLQKITKRMCRLEMYSETISGVCEA